MDTVQFKRGSETASAALKPGEPLFTDEGHLYVGNSGGGSTLVNPDTDKYSNTPVKIGTWFDGTNVMRKCGADVYAANSNPQFGTFSGYSYDGAKKPISGVGCIDTTAMISESYFVYKDYIDMGELFPTHADAVAEIQRICASGHKAGVEYTVVYRTRH